MAPSRESPNATADVHEDVVGTDALHPRPPLPAQSLPADVDFGDPEDVDTVSRAPRDELDDDTLPRVTHDADDPGFTIPPRPPLPVIPPRPPLPAAVLPPRPPLPTLGTADDEPADDEPTDDETADEPAVEDEVVIADESVGEDEPILEDESVAEDEPILEDEVAVEGEPILGDDPAVEDEPVVEDEPLVADEPLVENEVHVESASGCDHDAISLRGVVKVFGGARAVDGIDLTIPTGAFYGIVGPNGAGKTTTLSMIAGLLTPDRGVIRVCGEPVGDDPARAKRMLGVLPDRLRTFDRLTGRQLLYYYGVLRGLKPAVVEPRIADLARTLDLTESLGRPVGDYSAGMTKKVMLAGAMIHSPRVLVLDEPFEAVDPASSEVILGILRTYVEHGGTVVLSSHGMSLIESVCTHVAVLVGGQVLAEGELDEVRGGVSLEERFFELAGGLDDVEGLEWLHTLSD